ncbi:MAG: hypothetical protein ACYCUV_00635 [Phycisphaerae bacterium]
MYHVISVRVQKPPSLSDLDIRLLYDVEDQANEKQLDNPQRAQLRQTLAKPRLEVFRQWLLAIKKENGGHVLPKSPMRDY